MTDEAYSKPVRALLQLGKPSNGEWTDYRELGLTGEHIAELIRMAADDELNYAPSNTPQVWAPLHAWRALGQLGAVEAVRPLFVLLEESEENEWLGEDLPKVCAWIGAPAIPIAEELLADPERDLWTRATAGSVLEEIGQRHPETRDRCVTALCRQLEKPEQNDPTLNGFIVSDLVDLNARECLDTIREAFRKGAVDQTIIGDFQDVEIELGLREKRTGPHRHRPLMEAMSLGMATPDPTEADWRRAGRNDPCPCGSGIKYKECCLANRAAGAAGG